MKELDEAYGKIPREEYSRKEQELKEARKFEYEGKRLELKYIANHYYFPLILSNDEKIDYIKHVIKTKGEVKFINDLENYLTQPNNKFNEFNWWMFSKIDESLDEVYIPYYNPNVNKISYFYPDFIFWLEKGEDYFIVFVDPKGTEHTSAYRKIDGYKELFEENGKEKVFKNNGFNVRIKLRLRPEDVSKTLSEYRQYWFDDIE
ncbi:MAG: DEAD/DEAH box helicase family protein, partial [bacterium]